MMSLESVLKKITTRLVEPNLLKNLMNDYSKSRYYTVVSLQDIVRAQMGRLKWITKDRRKRQASATNDDDEQNRIKHNLNLYTIMNSEGCEFKIIFINIKIKILALKSQFFSSKLVNIFYCILKTKTIGVLVNIIWAWVIVTRSANRSFPFHVGYEL